MIGTAICLAAAATSWSPPAQAVWSGTALPVEVRVSSPMLSMSDNARIDVELVAQADEFAISPFVQATRGIALKVETLSGQPVDPAIPMPISPPPPPLEPYQLTRVAKGSSFLVHIREPTSTVFPGPGDYRMTVVLFLMDVGSQPSRRLIVESAATTVHVNK